MLKNDINNDFEWFLQHFVYFVKLLYYTSQSHLPGLENRFWSNSGKFSTFGTPCNTIFVSIYHYSEHYSMLTSFENFDKYQKNGGKNDIFDAFEWCSWFFVSSMKFYIRHHTCKYIVWKVVLEWLGGNLLILELPVTIFFVSVNHYFSIQKRCSMLNPPPPIVIKYEKL